MIELNNCGRPKKGEIVPDKEPVKTVKGFKYELGKNPENLTERQNSCLVAIRSDYPRLFRGYQLKEGLRCCSPVLTSKKTYKNVKKAIIRIY